MSRQLASRNNHFTTPALPGPVVAFREQRAGVEFNGVVALCSAMSPSEKRIAEQALTERRYGQRTLNSGMTVYVLRPATTAAPRPQTADQPKPKLSKQQRAAAEKKLVADLAALTASMPAAKPAKRRNRHERAQLAQ